MLFSTTKNQYLIWVMPNNQNQVIVIPIYVNDMVLNVRFHILFDILTSDVWHDIFQFFKVYLELVWKKSLVVYRNSRVIRWKYKKIIFKIQCLTALLLFYQRHRKILAIIVYGFILPIQLQTKWCLIFICLFSTNIQSII